MQVQTLPNNSGADLAGGGQETLPNNSGGDFLVSSAERLFSAGPTNEFVVWYPKHVETC